MSQQPAVASADTDSLTRRQIVFLVTALVFALNPAMPYNEEGQTGIEMFEDNPSYQRVDYATGVAFVKTQP